LLWRFDELTALGHGLLVLVAESLRESQFGLKRFGCGNRCGSRVKAKQIPLFVFVTFLTDVPAVLFVHLDGEQGANRGLVLEGITFLRADFMENTSVVEEGAPTRYLPKGAFPQASPPCQESLLLNEASGFGPKQRPKSLPIGLEQLDLLRINQRPPLLATDSITATTVGTLISSFSKIEDLKSGAFVHNGTCVGLG
jgi:hypothetical protein